MIYLSILLTACLFLHYQGLVSKENYFIKKYEKVYGNYIASSSLNFLYINSKDNLSWGLKLYLHSNGIIIGDPLNNTIKLAIPLEDIKNLLINNDTICFYNNLNDSYLPNKIELACSQHNKFSNIIKINTLKNKIQLRGE